MSIENSEKQILYSNLFSLLASSRVHSSGKHGTNEFLSLGIISTLFEIIFIAMEEFKLFNYLMTGPKKCEDCARPGVPGYTLFIREQRQNISLRRRPVTPTHSALIVFLYLPYLSFRPGIKCKMFYLSHFLPRPLSLCSISGSLGISIYHRSLTCFLLLFIMRSVDTEISLAPGPALREE